MIFNIICFIILAAVGGSYFLSTLNADNLVCTQPDDLSSAISFFDQENELKYHYDQSSSDLARIKQRNNEQFSRLYVLGDTLGLTVGKYNYQMKLQLKFNKADMWQDAYCPEIANMDVSIEYDAEIYIANDHTYNECAFQIVMQHEREHYTISRDNKRQYLSWLQSDLPSVTGKIIGAYTKPFSKGDITSVNDTIKTDIYEVLETYTGSMNAQIKTENAEIDTIGNYARLNKQIRECFK